MEDVLNLYAEPDDPHGQCCTLTRLPPSCWPRYGSRCLLNRDDRGGRTMSIDVAAPATSSWSVNPWRAGATWRSQNGVPCRTLPTRCSGWLTWPTPMPQWSDAPVVRVVLDNLNTHRMASLYETFPAAAARRIAKRLEFHHTPKHASWLNMAEIEFSALSRSCSRGEIPTGTPCNARSPPTKPNATQRASPSTRGSAPTTPEPNSAAFTPAFPMLTEY